jgi:hypothetical protein
MPDWFDDALKQAMSTIPDFEAFANEDPPEQGTKEPTWMDKVLEEHLANSPVPPDIFQPEVAFNFDHVRQVVAMIEGAIEHSKAELQAASKKILDAAVQASANDSHFFTKNRIFSNLGVGYWDVEMTFPLILRRSLLVAIYSHTEHILRQWCLGLHVEWKLPNSFNSFKKKQKKLPTPVLYLLYLRDEAKISFGNFESWPEWEPLDSYRKARNCLAHDGGLVEDSNDQKAIAGLSNIEVDDSGLINQSPTIILEPGACEKAVDLVEQLFERMWNIYSQDSRVAPHLKSANGSTP